MTPSGRTLFRFNGGMDLPQHKSESTSLPIARAPLPKTLVVPLRQHVGDSARPIVEIGARVLKGQMIGRAEDYISAAIHAPTSGVVAAIELRATPHPSGLPDLCIVIEADGEDQWIERHALDYRRMNKNALRNRLRDAGVVGLGGAAFPSYVKLNPALQNKVKTLIVNGAECEPYITCDDMLMRERADEIVSGVAILQWMLDAQEALIGVEDNKPEALAALRAAVAASNAAIEVIAVPTRYPSGGAKQLIRTLTGIEVPAGRRSTEFGVQCFNVATVHAVHRVVHHGEPVISRIVTIAGNVETPRNYEALIGAPIDELVAHAGEKPETSTLIMGGPMMGFALPSPHVPLVKASNCIIAASPQRFPPQPPEMPCIRCTACATACPADLQPQELFRFSKSKNFGKAQDYGLFDCIECGCCSYVCPSHIPLVQYYRFAKSEIRARDKEKHAADLARNRHEFRQFRIARDEAEKAEKLAAKQAEAKASSASVANTAETDSKKAAIAAAIERSKARKAEIAAKNAAEKTIPPDAEK